MPTVPDAEDRLATLVGSLDDDELAELWRHLDGNPDKPTFQRLDRYEKSDKISDELRRLFGHGVGNLLRRVRGERVSWGSIVREVATLVGTKTAENPSTKQLEEAIVAAHAKHVADLTENSDPVSLTAMADLALRAADDLAGRVRLRAYHPKRAPGRWLWTTVARPFEGPDYREVVHAVLFLLSAESLRSILDRKTPLEANVEVQPT